MLLMGEVQTGLLQNSGEIPEAVSAEVLRLVAGERVRLSLRPIAYAVSPDLLTGVDCTLPAASGARVRGIGTVISRVTLTGGRVLQGSSFTRLVRGAHDRRLPWSHYLARPGEIELLGKVRLPDLAEGVVAAELPADCLNLGAISGRAMDRVQASRLLDRRAPFRSARTRLRWAVTAAGEAEPGEVRFTLVDDRLRTLRVAAAGPAAANATALVQVCEDLALHDWLLTTVLTIIERARIGTATPREVALRLAPAIDHLLHLWMPAVRIDPALAGLWDGLERASGLTAQWQVSVQRIRDQLAVNNLSLLGESLLQGTSGHERR